jgi:cytochrome P450
MVITRTHTEGEIKHPINFSDKTFTANKMAYYRWLRDEAPVYQGKMSLFRGYFLSRYDDCEQMLKDPRFIRNRATATGGGGRLPFPLPKAVAPMMQSMILEDEPAHRRLRNLVHQAFTPRAIAQLGERVNTLSHELLEKAEAQGDLDLKTAYALPIPVTVISQMMGVPDRGLILFTKHLQVLTRGFSGWHLLHVYGDMRRIVNYVRELIAWKRTHPQDDILTGLIQAREGGSEKLSEDELVSMVILLIFAGYETTVHLICNSVVTLLQHPDQLARLQADPALMEAAIEEVLRYHGPIEGTKPSYAREEVTLHDVTIPKGSLVMPLLGAANHDERVFEHPEVFDITRSPNHHFGFGRGIHYCLGAPLARLETRVALTNLLDRYPNLRLAVKPEALHTQQVPMWNRYERLPVILA